MHSWSLGFCSDLKLRAQLRARPGRLRLESWTWLAHSSDSPRQLGAPPAMVSAGRPGVALAPGLSRQTPGELLRAPETYWGIGGKPAACCHSSLFLGGSLGTVFAAGFSF